MRYFGIVGYGTPSEEVEGVWTSDITERRYYGDVVRDTRRIVTGSDVNPDISTGNSVEIVADAYAMNHFHAIKYVEMAGALWTVTEVEQKRPRLILRLGGVYDGARPDVEDAANESAAATPEPPRRDSGR